MIQSFRDLEVWRKGMDLAVRVYETTDNLPRSEMFGLIGGKSYARHLKIAMGSESELVTQVELARRLNLPADADANDLLNRASEVGRMLAGLFRSLAQ